MQPNRPKLIALSGMDGAGKSKHARALADELVQRGARAVCKRLRFPFVTSVPVLLYARLRGHSYEIREGEQMLRAHAFAGAPLIRILYPLTLFLDLLLVTWILIRLPIAMGRTVVCDRFVLDSLIDVASSCELEIAPDSRLARLYETLVPPGTTTFLLAAPREVLLSRRAESSIDPTFDYRSQLYERTVEIADVHVVDSGGEFETAHERILEILTEEWPDVDASEPQQTLSRRWYAFLRERGLTRADGKLVLLLTHWLFQSVGAMGWTERALKAAIGASFFVPSFLILVGQIGPVFAGVLALLIAHTANFLLNAHIPVVLKHLGREVGIEEVRRYAEDLRKRMQGRPRLQGVVVIGSLARKEVAPGSDLDVRLIPTVGHTAALRAAGLALLERTRALLRMFPLDIYVSEDIRSLTSLREGRNPIILCDSDEALGGMFSKRSTSKL